MRWLTTGGLLVLLVLASTSAGAQSTSAILEGALELESRLLDRDLERYGATRRAGSEGLERLRTLVRDLDRAFSDPAADVEVLRRREVELAVARQSTQALLEESATQRRTIYARMERITELEADLSAARDRETEEQGVLDGTWRVTLDEVGITGVFDLEVDGALVTGRYLLSTGARGSLRGTLGGNRLELQRIDAGQGFDAVLRAELESDADGLVLSGSWEMLEVGGGAPAAGRWQGRKIAE